MGATTQHAYAFQLDQPVPPCALDSTLMRYTLEDSVVVERSPEDVYALISDVTRTGEWSEQCHACEWDCSARGAGATFTGHNRTPVREWSTVSTVTVDEPATRFEWTIGTSGTKWGYRVAAAGDGSTRLTEYTAFSDTGEEFFHEKYGDDADDQMRIRLVAAAEGIPATLARIKQIAEA